MYNKRKIGSEQEKLAADFLINQGYEVVEHNYYHQSGEIDIIAKDKDYLVFVEVKYRTSIQKGYPEEAVDYRKIKSIIRTARYYLLSHGYSEDTACRFDVVVILGKEIKLIENAFEL